METSRSTKENLDQSIGLLSQENAQRKSFLRLSTKASTPRRISLRQGYASRQNVDEDTRNDATSPMMMMNRYEHHGKAIKRDHSDFDASLNIYGSDAPSRSFRPTQRDVRDITQTSEQNYFSLRDMMEDGTSTGLVLKSDKPWRKAATKLYHRFLEIVQSHATEPRIFDTVADFIQNCTDTLETMRGMQAKVDDAELSDEEISLENERNTWRLVYCLYQNRLGASGNFQSKMETDNNNDNISEKDVVENLLKNEAIIREYQLIIDWLEKNAVDRTEKLPKVEHFTDKTVAWENTLHQLHNRQGGITFGSTRPLVTSLDPDAPIREGKPLHDLDKEDDARLEKRMFFEIRCGRLRRAQELSVHCGQPWRAACLLGWQPHHDPNYNNPLTDTKLPIEGNPNRSLWKLTAWHISEDSRVGQYYRAIYASLCGNLRQLLPVANCWEDELWAYIKCLMDIEVETEIRGVMAKNYIPMPDDYSKSKVPLEDIFGNVGASKNSVIRTQASKQDHLIQKYLILDQVPILMKDIDKWLDCANYNGQFLRFLAHLILFLRQIGKDDNDKIGDKVLLAYVRELIQLGDPTLVAFYTATLPQDEQVVNFARYLETVTEYEERKRCLAAAEDANLNVEAITKLVVENIRRKNISLEPKYDLTGKVTDADLEKIDALDWLTFYQSQREEALWQGNALIRYFLTCEKLDAARQAYNKIPSDAVEVIMRENPTIDDTLFSLITTDDLSNKANCAIREYLSYKAYLDAQEGFQEWFQHFHQDKPAPLDDLPSYATFTEKVAYDHKKAQYNAELDRWKCTMHHHTKSAKQLLYNVLLFPGGGWLVDCRTNNEYDEETALELPLRMHQLERLRNLCIPKISLLLLNVMSEMNEHANCVELADTLAAEQWKLYKVFSKERMREVFHKISESSVSLMDQRKDPWGYPR